MDFDLAVIGGGSGGFGAALAAGRRGLRVLLIEPGPMLGGNSTLAGVNTWEPGVGGPGFPAELYRRLVRTPVNIGVSRTIKHWSSDQPWGHSRVDRSLGYDTSQRRSGRAADTLTRVTFEPAAMAAEMATMLLETGKVDLRLGWRFKATRVVGRRIEALVLESPAGEQTVRARHVVDATAGLRVATSAGCRTCLGWEPGSVYAEPHGPAEHLDSLNGVSVCYRVTPVTERAVEPTPAGTPDDDVVRVHSITEYPCGDLNMNPLPLMDGWEFHRLGEAEGRRQCEVRLRQLWRWMQRKHGFDRYRLAAVFPFTGVREGPRLVARRVLNERDLLAGCSGQKDADRWITLADHAFDVHGQNHRCQEMREPYGVPYDCLLAAEVDNLAVACRGAGFSHIAASSCRLSRTMVQLGHAAGLGAALACAAGSGLAEVDVVRLQAMLREDDVSLDPDDRRFGGA